MATLQEKIDKRANIWSQMQEIRSDVDKDGWTAELREKWDRADTELVELGGDIERDQRDGKLRDGFDAIDGDTVVVDPSGDPSARADGAYRAAFDKFLRYGTQELSQEEHQLLRANFNADLRAQGAGTGAAGGYTVPEGFWAKVTETKKYFGGINPEVADHIETDTGADIPWPTNDDTGNEGDILGENTQASEQDATFGQKTLGAHMFTSKLIRASLQFLQDSAVDPESFLARRIGERIARRQNRAFTTGTGASEPQGFITGSTVGVTTASATVITYNEIVDLIHSVDAAYRDSGRCLFELHDLVLAYVRKIRDDSGGAGLGRPIWEPSIQVGVPDALLGFGLKINNNMDSTVAATKKAMAFGDFKAGYALRTVRGGQVMRLTERYADYLQVGFIGFERADGLVQDTSALKVLQLHA